MDGGSVAPSRAGTQQKGEQKSEEDGKVKDIRRNNPGTNARGGFGHRRSHLPMVVASLAMAGMMTMTGCWTNLPTKEEAQKIQQQEDLERFQEALDEYWLVPDDGQGTTAGGDDETEPTDADTDADTDAESDGDDGIWVITSIIAGMTFQETQEIDAGTGDVTGGHLTTFEGGNTSEYHYDGNGYRTARLDTDGWCGTTRQTLYVMSIGTDAEGRLASSELEIAGASYGHSDGSSSLTEYRYDDDGDLAAREWPTDEGMTREAFADGLIVSYESPDMSYEVTYGYDEDGRLASCDRSDKPLTHIEYEVDGNGNVTKIRSTQTGEDGKPLPNGTSETEIEYAYVAHPSRGARLYAQIYRAQTLIDDF